MNRQKRQDPQHNHQTTDDPDALERVWNGLKRFPGAPLLRAKRHPRRNYLWAIDCPFCDRPHEHGVGSGHRSPHCGSDFPSVQRPEGYIVVGPAIYDQARRLQKLVQRGDLPSDASLEVALQLLKTCAAG